MYRIVKSKSNTQPFQVVQTGKNGKVITQSETMSSKAKCFKNILASLGDIGLLHSHTYTSVFVVVNDEIGKSCVAYELFADGAKFKMSDQYARYIPGKNPKKKK